MNRKALFVAVLFVVFVSVAFVVFAPGNEDRGEYQAEIERPALVTVSVDDVIVSGYLALVNRDHAVCGEADFLVPVFPRVPVSFIDGMYLHYTALGAVESMIASARASDVGSFFVSSGFRGYEAQAELYDGGRNSAFALPPGHSEHHTGLAADIMAIGVGQWDLGNSPQGRWLANNSYRYGLILRYPQGAEEITGIVFEPWHFRYVGRVHAYFMRRKGLVLEEYLEMLRVYGDVFLRKNGIIYHVSHQVPENGKLLVPEGWEFTVSGDNLGGYIITAW